MNNSAKCESANKTSSLQLRKRACAISPVTLRRSNAPVLMCACAALLLLPLILQTCGSHANRRFGSGKHPHRWPAYSVRSQYDQLLNNSLGTAATCGMRGQTRIYGGSPVKNASDWPWMVSVYVQDLTDAESETEFVCGGTLISETGWVLTVAHCIPPSSKSNYAIGVQVATTKLYDIDKKLYAVSRAIAHPSFSRRPPKNDIGLLLIDLRNDTLPMGVRPICLPSGPDGQTMDFTNHTATIIGWGITEPDAEKPDKSSEPYDPELSDDLNEAQTALMNTTECASRWRNASMISIDSMLCTDSPGANVSACYGDSGGPLMWNSASHRREQPDAPQMNQTRFFQIGVTSFASRSHCGSKELPAVYTRVASYISWIVSIINGATY